MKMKLFKISLLLCVVAVFCSCTKNMEDKGLETAINYGVASSLFYKDCFCNGEMDSNINGRFLVEVFCFDDQTYGKKWLVSFKDFGSPIFSIFNIKYQYHFDACVSSDDLNLMIKSEKYKKTNCFVDLNNVSDKSIVSYFDKENLILKNLKNNLRQFVDLKRKKGQQSFYVGPFGEQASEIQVYWKEAGKIIHIERDLLDDPYMKKLNFSGITVRDFADREVINRILNNGVLISEP